MKKIDVKTLTSDEIKKELERRKYNNKYTGILKSTIYVLIVIAAIGALLAMFVTPVLQINTKSMSPTYNNGDIVVTVKTKKIKNGDVIAFYYGNKILISRVKGIAGDYINITDKGIVKVNGEIQIEEYTNNTKTVVNDIKYPYQVPAESYFVLNDDRESMIDSRTEAIGSIKQEDLVGKIILRVYRGK